MVDKQRLDLGGAPKLNPFEIFVASRYLRAKRKQAVIAVITTIAVLGIAAGVAVLVIALALVTGFNEDIQNKLLGGTAHLNLMRSDGEGIPDYREMAQQLMRVPGVKAAAATTYFNVVLSGANQAGAIIKGIDLSAAREANEIYATIIEGDVASLAIKEPGEEGIILGKVIANELNLKPGDYVNLISPQGRLTPFGLSPRQQRFRVRGIFQSGLYEYDSTWAYTSLEAAQHLMGLGDEATLIQMKVADIYEVKEITQRVLNAVGPGYTTTDWQELNKPVFAALQIQRLVVVIVLTLMIFIAALNIITTLTMMVVEKTRDISILMAMGATSRSIMRIFMLQGMMVGAIGTALGLMVGIVACLAADKYHLIQLPETIFSIAYAPFHVRVRDTLVVALIAMGISFLATIHPARQASRLDPVEGLRYE
ncbi:MAG: ABC transporter permease [Acidobacteria bacterium]|nr:ABC transporter permease [Acidobacteriota bacterium]